MNIWDYLEDPDKSLATPEEEAGLGKILQQCGSANTALLQLYRYAVRADQENESLLDEIERLGRLHNSRSVGDRDPLRPAQQ